MLPVVKPDVIYQSLNDGAVLFSTTDEVYFGMNEVAARIWEELPAHATWNELYAAVAARYPDVDPETLQNDIHQIVAELLEQKLLLPPPAA